MEKPTIGQRVNSFLKFIYDGETNTVLGRSGRSWVEIGVFYIIYYSCLAGFFAATLAVFYTTVDEHFPKLQGSDSLLKANPGMGFQPMPDIDSTLIYANKMKAEGNVKSIRKVLKEYKEAMDAGGAADCDLSQLRPDATSACAFNYTALTAECNEENNFGIKEEKPCVLLKLNRIFGWTPEIWDDSEIDDTKVADNVKNQYLADRIWIDCHGENPADKDNIGMDDITYHPQQGFPLGYYPYRKQDNYLAPLVFVKFNNVKRHMALMIECKALAKNIAVDRTEKEGSVHFELLVDP